MAADTLVQLVAEYGPWVILVFYLLWRDGQKDVATREALDRNTGVLIELATILKERTGKGYYR